MLGVSPQAAKEAAHNATPVPLFFNTRVLQRVIFFSPTVGRKKIKKKKCLQVVTKGRKELGMTTIHPPKTHQQLLECSSVTGPACIANTLIKIVG
jgi:hypothetical protein